MPGGSYRGPRAHGVPDQHDRDGPVGGGDAVESPVQVIDRRGPVAIPAAQLEPGPQDHGAVPPQRVSGGRRDRDTPQYGGVQGRGGVGSRTATPEWERAGAGGALAPARGLAG